MTITEQSDTPEPTTTTPAPDTDQNLTAMSTPESTIPLQSPPSEKLSQFGDHEHFMVTPLEDVFDCLPKCQSQLRPNKRPRIQIKLHTIAPPAEQKLDTIRQHTNVTFPHHYTDDERWAEQDLEHALDFFAETHEHQDPDVQLFTKERTKKQFKIQLDQLKQADEIGRRDIGDIVSGQLKEKQSSADRNIERLRTKLMTEEQKNLRGVLEVYNEKMASNQGKIDHGVKLLTRRHSQEMHTAALQHRQQCQQRGMPEQMIAVEWQQRVSQQILVKHQRQLQEFQAKGDEIKKRCESDYAREREKRKKLHDKRKREMEYGMQKVIARIHATFQQQHQRHLKRHYLRMQQQKDDLVAKLHALDDHEPDLKHQATADGHNTSSGRARDFLKMESEINAELNAPVNVSSSTLPGGQPERELRGAGLRHKHRKGVLGGIQKQLGVELHNEGLWLSVLTKPPEEAKEGDSTNVAIHESETKKNGNEPEFLPWGVKARNVLHAIICGEIPLGYGIDRFDFGEVVATQGGYIRCVITDLRTGETTASNQRAEAVTAQEEETIIDLEKKALKLNESFAEIEKSVTAAESAEKEAVASVEQAVKHVEKAKKMLNDFRTKFGRYFGPDGQLLPTTSSSDGQKLVQASMRFKTDLENADTKEKAAQKAVIDAKAATQKVQATQKQIQKAAALATTLFKKRKAMKEAAQSGKLSKSKLSEAAGCERAATRVADTIAALKKTAELRREHLNQKRSSTSSNTWVQALPGVTGAVKKSLWHKMHRRRANIILRPCLNFQLNELKANMRARSLAQSKQPSGALKEAEATEAEILAEQLFLLCTHPVAPSTQLPSVAPISTSDPWAEPGWQLNLDVPKDSRRSCLLPRAPVFPVFEASHIECCSVAGRQLASCISTSHLKSLSAPLSAVSQAISLAEVNPLITSVATLAENDPLNISDVAMEMGYSFQVKISAKASSQARRKPSNVVDLGIGKKIAKGAAKLEELQGKKVQLPSIAAKSAVTNSVPVTLSALSTMPAPSAQVATSRRTAIKSKPKPRPVKQRVPSNKDIIPTNIMLPESVPQDAVNLSHQQQLHIARQQSQSVMMQQQTSSMTPYGPMNTAQPTQQAPQAHLQQLQPQQLNQQILPSHNQPFNPQFHQQQMAQMHMIQQQQQQQQLQQQQQQQQLQQQQQQQQLQQQQQQQQQQQHLQQQQQRYPQQMNYFPPIPQQLSGRQPSFGTNQSQAVQQIQNVHRAPQQNPNQRRPSQQNNDDQNDPLFMLNDMNPGR